jgi:hypothetical protein
LFADMTDDREELGEDIWRRFTPRRGIDMPAPGNTRGERMQHGYAPEGGKRITAHHCRVAKGVNGIIILLPILGECWLLTIPKALPWADLFLVFLSPLCFESEQARAQAVFTPTVYTPLPWGGGIMFFCPSVINKGVCFYLPSLGEGLGVGILSFCLI